MNPHRNLPWSLSIDKISLVRYDPSPAHVSENCDRLVEAFEANRFLGAAMKSGRRHRIQLAIPIFEDGSLAGRLLIQAGPRFPGLCDYRIECNPALLGIEGVYRVSEILGSVFVEPTNHLLRKSFVTRIDLALDLHGLSVDQVALRRKRQRKHGIFSNQYGIPETIYLGKPKSNQTAVYNKGGGSPVMRVERRLNPKCRGDRLASLPDPFGVVQMVHTDALRPFLNGMIPNQFFDSIRVRGFTHVLATLPAAQRRAIKAVLKDPAQSALPSTEEVWRSWPELLRTSGLGFLTTDFIEDVGLVPKQAMPADEIADGRL
jgi:hypothetical protein